MPAPSSKAVAHHRAQVARRRQSYPKGHARVTEAERDLKAAKAEAYVAEIVSSAPPLTTEQRERIAMLLRAGGGTQ